MPISLEILVADDLKHMWYLVDISRLVQSRICLVYTKNIPEIEFGANTGLILGLRLANERRRYFVTTSLIGWAQT